MLEKVQTKKRKSLSKNLVYFGLGFPFSKNPTGKISENPFLKIYSS